MPGPRHGPTPRVVPGRRLGDERPLPDYLPAREEPAEPDRRINNWSTIFTELTWPAATTLVLTGPGGEEDNSTPILRGARGLGVLLAHALGADDG